MRFDILGPLGVIDGDREIFLPPGRQRSLLALLATRARQTVTTDRIVDLLWREDEVPAHPANAVQSLVSRVRRATTREGHEPLLCRRATGYVLDVPAEDIDAQRFERGLTDGRRAMSCDEPAVALTTFNEALGLWRGQPLEDIDADWTWAEAERLEELRLNVLEERADVQLVLGQHGDSMAELDELVSRHPLRERLRGSLMLALYRSGRQADALRVYQEGQRILADELGLDPEVRLRELHQRILEQSPELDWRQHRGEASPASPASAADHRRPGRSVDVPGVVGRAPELASLLAAWDRTCNGHGSLALIAGEPGVGKSHLVAEFVSAVAGPDTSVQWGRCLEHEGAPPFWPWVQALRGIIDDLDDDALERTLGSRAADIAQLIPEVKDRIPHVGSPPAGDPAHTRFQLYDAVSRFLGSVTSERPLLTVVEDIHWGDEPSLELLGVLATNLRTLPMMLVVTYREGPADRGAPLTDVLARLAREPVVHHHVLRGLSRDEVATLLAERLGAAPDELVESIHDRTEGNPFFVSQLLTLLRSDPDPRVPVPASMLAAAVPAGVREVIDRRVSLLPATTRHALAAATVIGREFRTDILATVTAHPTEDLLSALEPAIAAGIVVRDELSPTTYRFVHALVRDAIYARTPDLSRARTHASVGAALDMLGDDRRLAQVAHHYERAAPLGFAAQAVDAAMRAATHAERILAFEPAEQHLRRALRVLDSGSRATDVELEVRGRLAALLLRTGGYGAPEVRDAVVAVRDLAADLGASPQVVGLTWAHWVHLCVRADFAGALRIAQELLADGLRTSDDAAIAAGHQASGTTLWHLGRIDEAATSLRRGIEAFADIPLEVLRRRGLQHAVVLGRCHTVHPLFLLGEDQEAERYLRDAREIAEALGDPYEIAFCTLFDAWLALLRGDVARVWGAAVEAVTTSDAHGFPLLSALAGCLAGWAEAARGDVVEGTERIEDAIEAADATGARMLRHFHLGLLADSLYRGGHDDDAARTVRIAIETSEGTGEAFHLPALEQLQSCLMAGGWQAPDGGGPTCRTVR